MSSNNAYGCLNVCFLFMSIGLSIPTIYYGFSEEDATCQQGTRAGLILSDWVKVQGLKTICANFAFCVFVAIAIAFKSNAAGFFASVVSLLNILFTIIWFVIGVVVLATNENNSCVAEGNPLAVITIINFFLTWSTLNIAYEFFD